MHECLHNSPLKAAIILNIPATPIIHYIKPRVIVYKKWAEKLRP